MVNAHSKRNRNINAGFGVSYMKSTQYEYDIGYVTVWKYYVSYNVSYGYQPLDGGVFISIGFAYVYAMPTINLSLGYVF